MQNGSRVRPLRAAVFSLQLVSFETLYARADAALYEAKAGGRDRVRGGPSGPRLQALDAAV